MAGVAHDAYLSLICFAAFKAQQERQQEKKKGEAKAGVTQGRLRRRALQRHFPGVRWLRRKVRKISSHN